jgi:tRNA G18 (ribose-2'-O)-methylase SpoU
LYTADAGLLAELTGFALSQGVLCAMRRPLPLGVEEVCVGARRVAMLEGMADSTNLGAVFRSAAALGVDAVLLAPNCCDPLLRRAVRVSMGTIFQIPWARIVDDWPSHGMERLRRMGFKTVAMALSELARPIDDAALMAEERLAILLGAEGSGLSAETIAECDYIARIPMSHYVDSLNVAAAAAVAFWQLRARPQ